MLIEREEQRRERGFLLKTTVFARLLFPALLFAVVGGNVGFGLYPRSDSFHPLLQGFVEAADDLRPLCPAVEAAVVHVHDDAPCADEPCWLRQPGCLLPGGLLYDDLVAAIRRTQTAKIMALDPWSKGRSKGSNSRFEEPQ